MKLSAAKSATKYTSLLFITLTFMLGLSLTGNIFAWLRLDVYSIVDKKRISRCFLIPHLP